MHTQAYLQHCAVSTLHWHQPSYHQNQAPDGTTTMKYIHTTVFNVRQYTTSPCYLLCQLISSCLLKWRFGLDGNGVSRINDVNQRQARLVLGWVTISRWVNYRYVTSHPGQLSLAIPSWAGTMTTCESWDTNRHTARCTSHISLVSQCKLVLRLIKRESAAP